MTQDVLKGMTSLIETVQATYGSLNTKSVVDVGCNDGSLLKYFRAAGATVLGIEPTAAAFDAEKSGIEVFNEFFDTNTARKIVAKIGHPDFVTFTNVFAHIENIDELLQSVAILLGPSTRLVVENHYLGAVLKRFQFDTFYHEHPRTYSLTSFVAIASRLGRHIESAEFPIRYGGNIRVIIGPTGGNPGAFEGILRTETSFPEQFTRLRAVLKTWLASRENLLAAARSSDGRVYAKAFPGRAAILIKLLNLTERDLAAVFEKPGSQKIGHYVPGTRIPILSDEELLGRIPQPRKILNLAWHISGEIHKYLNALDPDIQTVDIFAPGAFE